MSHRNVSPTTLVGIKRYAKQLKAHRSVTHSTALDLAAQAAGFENFRHARAQLPSPDGPNAAPGASPALLHDRPEADRFGPYSIHRASATADARTLSARSRWLSLSNDSVELAAALYGLMKDVPLLNSYEGDDDRKVTPNASQWSVASSEMISMRLAQLDPRGMSAADVLAESLGDVMTAKGFAGYVVASSLTPGGKVDAAALPGAVVAIPMVKDDIDSARRAGQPPVIERMAPRQIGEVLGLEAYLAPYAAARTALLSALGVVELNRGMAIARQVGVAWSAPGTRN